jgi:hypothetical protein
LRANIVEHGRKHVEASYDIQKVIPRIEAFYREVASKKGV